MSSASSKSVTAMNALDRALHLDVLIAVMFGGALGALSRELLALWFTGISSTAFPLGILLANLSGAFMLGLFATWIDGLIRHHAFRPFWEAGFVRSFTTLSTFSLQSIILIEAGAWSTFIPYVAISVVGGLTLIWCGERLGVFFVARAGGKINRDDQARVEKEL
jgi:CrcB protein